MSVQSETSGVRRGKSTKTILSMLAGGVLGFCGATGLIYLVEAGHLGKPGPSQVVALLVALVYGLVGLIVIAGVASPRAGAKFLNVEDAEELIEQKPSLVASGWGMLLLGLVLAIVALGGPGGALAPPTALLVTVPLLLVGVWLSVRSLRHADELMVALSGEATRVSYTLLFVIMGGWAALAHLGFAPAPAMLDLLTAFWALALAATFWAAGRRGLLAPR